MLLEGSIDKVRDVIVSSSGAVDLPRRTRSKHPVPGPYLLV